MPISIDKFAHEVASRELRYVCDRDNIDKLAYVAQDSAVGWVKLAYEQLSDNTPESVYLSKTYLAIALKHFGEAIRA